MYALVPSIAKEIMAEDGKYLLEKRYSREEASAHICTTVTMVALSMLANWLTSSLRFSL